MRVEKKIQIIVLAAGSSQRFGPTRDKTHIKINGRPMPVAIALSLKQFHPDVLLIINEKNSLLQQSASSNRLAYRINPEPDNNGIGSSISLAVQATADADGWIFCLGDMPRIKAETCQQVLGQLLQRSERAIIIPRYAGQTGHPVGFGKYYRQALGLKNGDSGAKTIIQAHPQQIHYIETDDPGIIQDIDTPTDISILKTYKSITYKI